MKMKGFSDPAYFIYKLLEIYEILEDVHSVGSMTEFQEAIDSIGTGAGTIFIEAGTHIVDTPIDIDGGGSLVIYGHGDNTILEADDGISVFNITDCVSLTVKNLQIDATNYTGATSSVIVNEANDNVITIEDVTIVGNNLGTGIELVSDNCIIEHCNISQLQDGIYLNNSIRHIIAQNILSSNARYGIYLDNVLYSSINGNTSILNLTGIYVLDSSNNSISNNICNQNSENGIYLYGSSYNTISGNTCKNNDSNTINPQAGMYVTNNSDFNTISGNSLNNNNNIGAGEGYGLIIATATCDENVVAANNYNGNDIDIHDIGVGTTVKYYVQNVDELQDAITSIGSKSGIIVINSSFNVSVTIIIDGNGSYLIEGEGDNTVLTTVGDIKCFNIDIARQVVFKNFKINASSLTTATREIIDVNENNNNLVIIDNIAITGDGSNGHGIEVNSENVQIVNCNINNVNHGIYVYGDKNTISNNTIVDCLFSGIYLNTANLCELSSNYINNIPYAIYLITSTYNAISTNVFDLGTTAIALQTDSTYNSIANNVCSGQTSRAVFLGSGSNYNSVIGTINYNSYGGIKVHGCTNCTISANVIRSPTAGNEGGIYIADQSDNCIVSNNILVDCDNNAAIRLRYTDSTVVSGNTIDGSRMNSIQLIFCNSCSITGNTVMNYFIMVGGSVGSILVSRGSDNSVVGNTLLNGTYNEIDSIGAIGIYRGSYNLINGNVIRDLTNTGAGNAYGIYIHQPGATVNNIIGINQINGCADGDVKDNGTGTILFGDDTVYGAAWDTDLGTPTKNAVYDKIQLIIAAYQAYANAKVSDAIYGAGWGAITTIAPSKKAVYDKIESMITKYNTGWINRTDWTNVHMGSSLVVDADSNVAHNLNASLSELSVRVFISTDGTDANSFETHPASGGFVISVYGHTIYQVDANNIKVQTGVGGLLKIEDNGTVTVIAGQDWHYKIVVKLT